MHDNYFFLKRFTNELNKTIAGFQFLSSFSQNRNEIVFSFCQSDVFRYLVFNFDDQIPVVLLKRHYPRAKSNFATFFEELNGKILSNILIENFERNIRLNFESEQLVILIRGKHSNVVKLDEQGIIKSAFKHNEEILEKSFNELYTHQNFDPTYFEEELKFKSLIDLHSHGKKTLYTKIIGNQIIQEILIRSKQNEKSYIEIFKSILEQINTDDIRYNQNGFMTVGHFYSLSNGFQIEPDFFKAVSKSFSLKQKYWEFEKTKTEILNTIDKKLFKRRNKIAKLKTDKTLTDHTEEYRQLGNLILQYASHIHKGDEIFKAPALTEEAQELTVKLDKSKTPFENAELYFQKAREEKNRLASAKKLIHDYEQNIFELKNLREALEKAATLEELEKIKATFQKITAESNRKKDSEKSKFRHFIVFNKYDVYVGKDKHSNDLLTTEFAKPDDIWVHARGSSGSHVIIKKKNKNEE
ncbi:MAG: NFACT RNA binding domain-containing protein, partial [Ignavibacteria bacterium]|nr:NFACT RNA binding domain-containing protein [Ignavibacteria bacterium]